MPTQNGIMHPSIIQYAVNLPDKCTVANPPSHKCNIAPAEKKSCQRQTNLTDKGPMEVSEKS